MASDLVLEGPQRYVWEAFLRNIEGPFHRYIVGMGINLQSVLLMLQLSLTERRQHAPVVGVLFVLIALLAHERLRGETSPRRR